jgi:Flp pilus assembly protein TadD
VAQCDAGGMKPVAAGEESHLHEEPPTDEDPVIQIAGLEAMLEHDPENDELLGRLGELLAIEGEVDRAKLLVGRAMAIDPTDVEWPRTMGAISGRPRLEILEELVLLHPELDELHGDIGDLLVDLGRVEEARQAYEKASALDPEDKEWKKKIKLLAL